VLIPIVLAGFPTLPPAEPGRSCKPPATWDRALGYGTGRILPEQDVGSTTLPR
jgi:hypothetical protein